MEDYFTHYQIEEIFSVIPDDWSRISPDKFDGKYTMADLQLAFQILRIGGRIEIQDIGKASEDGSQVIEVRRRRILKYYIIKGMNEFRETLLPPFEKGG